MDGCIISAENVHREVGGASMGGGRAPFLLKRSGLRTSDVLQIANISPKHVQVCNDGVVCASLAFVSNRLCDADAAANPGYFQRQGCVLLHHLTRPLNSRKNTFGSSTTVIDGERVTERHRQTEIFKVESTINSEIQ